MHTEASRPSPGPAAGLFRSPGRWWRFTRLLLVVLACLTMPGCGGCTSDDDPAAAQKKAEEEAKKKKMEEEQKKKKPKPDFEAGPLITQPGSRSLPLLLVKPGHWVSATQAMTANNYTFQGQLEAGIVDTGGYPVYLDRTPYRLTSTRPVALFKGQQKYLETVFFVPHGIDKARIAATLQSRGGGGAVKREDLLFNKMPPYQYFFVVLARSPESYQFLAKMTSVRVPWNDETYEGKMDHYRVVYPRAPKSGPVLIPSQWFAWTSIAYVLWDDMDQAKLSPEQQQAMLDWLHWGGQLIVSGPASLENLAGSFLAPYLPATAGDVREYTADDLAIFSGRWSIPEGRNRAVPLAPARPFSGIELVRQEGGRPVPGTDGLLLERQVGRGRIVVSAFRLREPALAAWRSFDSFFNAVLLRRPPRRYKPYLAATRLAWAKGRARPDDPQRTTNVRYFSRDAGNNPNSYVPQQQRALGPWGEEEVREGEVPDIYRGGVASWNPHSAAAAAARDALREAAGIEIPRAEFVLWVVGFYLVVLVPMNWGVFYVIGRVEWAWVAAPVIAVVFSVLVVYFAQLDIGFVRANTEVAVLEAHGGYPRAHLTRFTALYTSLATTYDAHYDSPGAVAQPFPLSEQRRAQESRGTIAYRREKNVSLEGLAVSSNATGMIHSEAMFDLGGAIRLVESRPGRLSVKNGSDWDLSDVFVLRRNGPSRDVESARIGWLASQQASALNFSRHDASDDLFGITTPSGASGELNLAPVVRVATNAEFMDPGEIRLIGRIGDKLLPGSEIDPDTRQVRAATLVVVHLKPGDLPTPQRDENLSTSVDAGGFEGSEFPPVPE